MERHGLSKTRIYRIYKQIQQRCYNPNNPNYYRYGGIGVEMCQEWRNSFQAFFDWSMGKGYTDEMTIDRLDSCKGYTPENCQWVGLSENSKRVSSREGTNETKAAREVLKENGRIQKTSSAVKRRYNQKAYKSITVQVKPELAARLQEYKEREGISMPELLYRAMDALTK